ncbi:hypothetical protein [Sphingobium xenophagum]|nr:hypothetical protein [Sphingobium xenophagum]
MAMLLCNIYLHGRAGREMRTSAFRVSDRSIISRHVVSQQWVKAGQMPADEREGPEGGYGYQWWTMANSPAYSAIGLQGQYVYIDPASRTVVVKLSYFPSICGQAKQETLAFLAAASAWQPAK